MHILPTLGKSGGHIPHSSPPFLLLAPLSASPSRSLSFLFFIFVLKKKEEKKKLLCSFYWCRWDRGRTRASQEKLFGESCSCGSADLAGIQEAAESSPSSQQQQHQHQHPPPPPPPPSSAKGALRAATWIWVIISEPERLVFSVICVFNFQCVRLRPEKSVCQ